MKASNFDINALISFDTLNIASLMPVGILVLGALVLICLDLINKNLKKEIFIILSLIMLALSFFSIICYKGASRGFFDAILIDGVARLSSMIVLMVSGLFLLFSFSRQSFHESDLKEFYAMYLLMNAGFMQMCLSDNLIVIFVGLETGSLALYALIAMHNRLKSIEAALKYFTMGALASGLFGMSAFLFYLASGSLQISQIMQILVSKNLAPAITIVSACVFLLASLGFKLSLVPFHTWTPDIYEGSTSQMAGYMSIVPKITSFIVVMRIFEGLSNVGLVWVDVMLYIVAVLTMSIANVAALIQKDLKRMLGFSSISHAGFLLSAILIGTDFSNSAFFVYWIMFSVANLGAFAILWISKTKQSLYASDDPYEKFAGLIKTSPFLAVCMAIFMVSLAGIPPFSLFWGKLFILSSAVNNGYFTLAIVMAINSAIALWYYLKLVVFMFLHESKVKDGSIYLANSTLVIKSVISFAFICCIIAIVFTEPILQFIQTHLATTNF